MGKAARMKAERRAAPPPPVGKERPFSERTKLVWGATAALVVVVGIVVGVLVATRDTGSTPPPAASSSLDTKAPAALVAAADAVGFQPTTEPGAGEVETRPASDAVPSSNFDLLPVGSKAPGFTLKTPQGAPVSLSDSRGKAVLLEFFATWCPHCNAEAPHLADLARSLPASRYSFLSVNADGETAPSVFAYHRYFGFPFPALLDPSAVPGSFHQQGAAGPVTQKYGVQAYPTFYVIDPKGRITWASDGEQPDTFLRQQLVRAAARG